MGSLKIEHISTSGQAAAFARRIASDEVRTYFLQGSWGSGKSEYLRAVKESGPLKGFTFVELELWKPKDKQSLASKIFSVTNPRWAKALTVLGWLFIGLAVIGSTVLAVQSIVPWLRAWTAGIVLLTGSAAMLTTVYGFLQNKWLDVDRILLWISSRTLKNARKPKVLVIDDFDRLDDETQKELYLFFNMIHGRTRIIFVGDMGKLKNKEDNYLGKIIDQKVVLPFQLESRNISQKITEAINTRLKINFNPSVIEELFAEDTLTARDANQYLSYVESEFIGQQKKGRVQSEQELFIIYLYLFHPDEYRKLVRGWMPAEEDGRNGAPKEEKQEDNEVKSLITANMDSVLRHNKDNPPDFCANTSMYFVNEFATNHSLVELNEIIKSDADRRKFFLINDFSDSADYDEILNYIENMTDREYQTVQEQMEYDAVSTMHSEVRHVPNRLVKLVFTRRLKLVEEPLLRSMNVSSGGFDKALLDEFEGIFNTVQERLSDEIGITERMYCYRTCINLYGTFMPVGNSFGRSIPAINEDNVSGYFSAKAKEVEQAGGFGQHDYDAESLISQLGYRYWLDGPINPSLNPDFQSKVESIEKLNPQEYRAFWNVYGIEPAESDPEELIGGAALSFSYNNQSYDKHVLARLND